MIRNFWQVSRPPEHKGPWRLVEEIKAIENKVDPNVWAAIDAVRKVGNIGAHMEQDVNVVIDIEPEEAEKLIWLVELLIEQWYIRKHETELKLAEIKGIGDSKVDTKKILEEPK
jgi:hypothetical protein